MNSGHKCGSSMYVAPTYDDGYGSSWDTNNEAEINMATGPVSCGIDTAACVLHLGHTHSVKRVGYMDIVLGTTAPPWRWCATRTTGFRTTCEFCALCCRVSPFPALGTDVGIPAPLESTLVFCRSVKKATDFNQSM